MTDYPDNPGPLPAEKLGNPGEGEEALGALGNETSGKMYYKGGDKKELVTTVQQMLVALLFDIGDSGPNADGVDGKYGKKTEDAVAEFQKENKDWNGNPLKVDGLVGPHTSDALNRAMVGQWYDHYQTPPQLVDGMPYHAVTSEFLKNGLSIGPDGTKKARVFLTGPVIRLEHKLRILLHDRSANPMSGVKYRLHAGDSVAEGVAEDGWVEAEYPPDQCIECSVEWGEPDKDGNFPFHLGLAINCDKGQEKELAMARLNNLGYVIENDYEDNVRAFQADYAIGGEDGLRPDGTLPPGTKKALWDIYGVKDCNASRPGGEGQYEQPDLPTPPTLDNTDAG